MMKKGIACVLILCLVVLCGLSAVAEELSMNGWDELPELSSEEMAQEISARELLEGLGFIVSDEFFHEAIKTAQMGKWYLMELVKAFKEFDIDEKSAEAQIAILNSGLTNISINRRAYEMLMLLGMGDDDWENDTWTPYSTQVYAFDGEIYNVDEMYTEFLQRVSYIIPDAEFSDIEEDLSGMDFSDKPALVQRLVTGTRKVMFICNGTHYEKTLVDRGDWFDINMLDFVNKVLQENGCAGQLHVVSDDYEQFIMLIYGTEAYAQQVRETIETNK